MELQKFSLGRKAILFKITVNPESKDDTVSVEERTVAAREQPLPSLTKAFAALAPVFCDILELPAAYVEGLSVTTLTVTRTKGGTRSVSFSAKKQLNVRRDYLHGMDCPFVQIDKPADGESGDVQIEAKSVKLITNAITQAEKYAKGERSQKLLDFEGDKAALNAQFKADEPELL